MHTRKVVSVGVDYITLTAADPQRAFVLSRQAHVLLQEEIAKGNMQRPWGMSGYQGWRVGPVQWGERPDGVIARLSSTAAAENWWDLYQTADNCSRVDLQVTVHSTNSPTKEVMNEYRAVRKYWAGRRDGPTVTIWRSGDEGTTLYLGKRSSRLMVRIYDKQAESGHPEWANCVRYEVEFKACAAKSTIESIVGQGLVHDRILQGVIAIVRDRGGLLPVKPNGRAFPVMNAPRMATDCDSRLKWLRVQVRPSCKMLIAYGLENELFEALGLSPIAGPNFTVQSQHSPGERAH